MRPITKRPSKILTRHKLHLAVNKAVTTDRVSAFTRSPKLVRQHHQKTDRPLTPRTLTQTWWTHPLEFFVRFLEQQQAGDRKKWHLMPKDTNIAILETFREVLWEIQQSPVLPLMWRTLSCLEDEDSDFLLGGEMKGLIKENIRQGNDDAVTADFEHCHLPGPSI